MSESTLEVGGQVATATPTSDICSNTTTVINNTCDGDHQVNGHWSAGEEAATTAHDRKAAALGRPKSLSTEHSKTPTLVNGDSLDSSTSALFQPQHPDIDVLIMSEAGKPIYCYSEREDHTTLMGVCVALLNFVLKTQSDTLRSIHTRNGLHINFAYRPPLVIVVVCRQHSCFDEQTLINQINAQIVSTITLKSLKSIFQQAPTYDLKRLIHNNEFRTMNILVQSISTPIADLFITYQDYLRANFAQRSRLKRRLFNNVISFYTPERCVLGQSRPTPANSTTTSPSLNSSPVSGATSPSVGTNANNSSIVFLQESRSNYLSRVYVPIAIIPVAIRDQIAAIISQAVANYGDLVFSILFTIIDEEAEEGLPSEEESSSFELLGGASRRRNTALSSCTTSGHSMLNSSEDEFLDAMEQMSLNGGTGGEGEASTSSPASSQHQPQSKNLKLVTVGNHNAKLRISPLDIQLIYALIKASDSQLSSTESLWLPLCLSRIDANRFMYAHISYLTEKYCLVLLDLDQGDFQRCQQAKETIQEKLESIKLIEPMNEIRSCISELGQHHLQYICHQTLRHCIMWQASTQTAFSHLNYYLIDRMQRSSLKTCWLRSSRDQCALLGWHSQNFQLYAQFDITVSQYEALDTVQSFIKWFKKEEEKLVIKDG